MRISKTSSGDMYADWYVDPGPTISTVDNKRKWNYMTGLWVRKWVRI